jgi:hypothetical protein
MHAKSDPNDLNTRKLTLTTFKDEKASNKRQTSLTLPEWQEHIRKRSENTKEQLPRLSGLIFGSIRTGNNCLRHDANVKKITAIVVEYDGPQNGVEQQISIEEAKATIEKAALRALLSTTSSHTEAEPRWRIVFPLSQHEGSCEADCKVRHEALVAMVNGVFNGQLAPESFTLSLPWHYGKVGDNPDYRDEIISGAFLNIRDDLFAGRVYKNGSSLPRAEQGQSKSRDSRRRRADRDVFETFADDIYEPTDKAEVEFALSKIPADDYRIWMRVGAALFDEFEDDGFELFDPWSQTCPKKYDSDICKKKWNDFSKMTEFGIGTVFHLATEADPEWREQWREQQPDDSAFADGPASKTDGAAPHGIDPDDVKQDAAASNPQGTTPPPDTATDTDDWCDPVDLWSKFNPPELPTDLLPKTIEKYARIEGENMGCDPAGLAMAALTASAAAVSDTIRLQVKEHDEHWTEPARVWAALVGDPSAKKTPTLNQAAWPIARIDRKLIAQYLAEKETYDALSAADKKNKPPPKQPRIRIEDTTIEAAQEVLKDSPDGVLCLQDELSGFFGTMDKY